MSTTTTAKVVDPPFYDPPIADSPSGQQHSQAWTEYHQQTADQINALTAQLTTLTSTIGQGVTDGSDAAAGQVGELLTASSPGAPLANATPLDRVTLPLPPGDWDVAGAAIIVPTLANMTYGQAWLSTAANTPTDPGRSAVQSGGAGTLGTVALVVGPVRFSSSSSQTVHLGCQANFPGGTTVTAGGWLRARRMR